VRLLAQVARAAASRTFWTAGSKRPTRTAMIAITTRSSIRVNPPRRERAMRGLRRGRSGRALGARRAAPGRGTKAAVTSPGLRVAGRANQIEKYSPEHPGVKGKMKDS